MMRMVYDIGDAMVRLQAPEGWVRIGQRGSRILLADSSCPTPIFVEPLPGVDQIDRWIAGLIEGVTQLTGHQQVSGPEARRFVLIGGSGGNRLDRAYRIGRVPSSRASSGIWVAASIDLDGDRKRARLLDSVFPNVTDAPNLRSEPGVRQYVEDSPAATSGAPATTGFTLKLPRLHAIANSSGNRFLVHDEHNAPLGWMGLERATSPKGSAPAAPDHDGLPGEGDVAIHRLSETAWIVSPPDRTSGPPETRDGALWVRLRGTENDHLVVSLSTDRSRGQLEDFLRRIHTDLRIWNDRFRGYWREPARVTWTEVRQAPSPPPRPVPPKPVPTPSPSVTVEAEWDSRLSGTVLNYESPGQGVGYDPHASFGSYRKSRLMLDDSHSVEWEEIVFTSASYGIYVGGERRESRSGRWRVEVSDGTPQLVLNCGSEGGLHRFVLGGREATAVNLDGRRYSLKKF